LIVNGVVIVTCSGRCRFGLLVKSIEQIQNAIAAYRPLNLEAAVADMWAAVTKTVVGLKEALATSDEGNVTAARAALAKHLGNLTLTRQFATANSFILFVVGDRGS
jgi:hypothetical protein